MQTLLSQKDKFISTVFLHQIEANVRRTDIYMCIITYAICNGNGTQAGITPDVR